MRCPRCGAKAIKVALDQYDCTERCGVYLIHKLTTVKSRFKKESLSKKSTK